MNFVYQYRFEVGYLLGLVIAMLWGRLEVWGKRDPQTISSHVMLLIFGWVLVPIFSIGIVLHSFFLWLGTFYLSDRKK